MKTVSCERKRRFILETHTRTLTPSILRLALLKLDYLERNEVAPRGRPFIEQRRRVGLHKLEAAISVFLQPALDVTQAIRQHSAFLSEALIDARLAARPKSLEHHVFHTGYLSDPRLVTM